MKYPPWGRPGARPAEARGVQAGEGHTAAWQWSGDVDMSCESVIIGVLGASIDLRHAR